MNRENKMAGEHESARRFSHHHWHYPPIQSVVDLKPSLPCHLNEADPDDLDGERAKEVERDLWRGAALPGPRLRRRNLEFWDGD
jgi:hypothetical protein